MLWNDKENKYGIRNMINARFFPDVVRCNR